ncbi:MAG: Spy/CpxP family protein refolding chaperone [candidate division Zixibacteria bacterium]|nr:Spy/CpxP family protein refolding chaperone [candidate division Zixibacteria bacterium]
MKKTLVVTMALALLATAALAQSGFHGKGHGGGQMQMGQHPQCAGPHHGKGPNQGMSKLLMFADEIGLTDDQQEKIKTLSLEHKMAMVDLHATAKKTNLQVKALMTDDAPESEVLRAMEKASQAKFEISKAKYLQRQQCLGFLTDEQQDKLKELRQDRRGQRFEGKGDGRRKSFRDGRHGR